MIDDNDNELYGTPPDESEEPLERVTISSPSGYEALDLIEKDKERLERRFNNAYGMMFLILTILGFIYLTELLFGLFISKELPDITNNIIEILKALLFSLSGYLFSRKEGDK